MIHLLDRPFTERNAEDRGIQVLHRTTTDADDPGHLTDIGRQTGTIAAGLIRRQPSAVTAAL